MTITTVAPTRLDLPGFGGELLGRGDPGYDTARRIWNGAIDRYPAFIARCTTTADVAAAVRFGRRHELPIAVRGGGHSIPGYSVCEGGLMIDLSPMKQVDIDPAARTARVEPGVLWGEFDAAAQAHGLATPGGEISDTGVAGLTLGGGIGWLSRQHGLAVDNLLSVELVTADGGMREVDDAADPELMWGLRGGGGNFGIVTSFRFRLHPVGPVSGGLVMFPAERAVDVLRLYRDVGAALPDNAGIVCAMITAPPAPDFPAELRGRPVIAIAAAYFGDVAAGEQALAPLRQTIPPALDAFGVLPYTALQQLFDAGNVPGRPAYVKSDFLRELDGETLQRLAEFGTSPTSPFNQVVLRRLGGAFAVPDPTATAFGHRDAEHLLLIAAVWPDPAADASGHISWAREGWAAVRPWFRGTYVNHLGDEGADRLREAYPDGTWQRLTQLKRRLDPDNAFALNQNIPPATD